MSVINVGGMFVRNKCKSLNEAVQRAHPGDTIMLHRKHNLLESGVQIRNKSLYIEGADADTAIEIKSHHAAIGLTSGNLHLKNLHFLIPNQANGLNVNAQYQGQIVMDHCYFEHVGKIVWREFYPSVCMMSKDEGSIQLQLYDTIIDTASLHVNQLQVQQGQIGDLLVPRSVVWFNQGQFQDVWLDHVELMNLKQKSISLMKCTTEGGLELVGDAVVPDLTFREASYDTNDRHQVKQYQWQKQQMQDNLSYFRDEVSGLTIFKRDKQAKTPHVTLIRPHFVSTVKEGREAYFPERWFNFVNAEVELQEAQIPVSRIDNSAKYGSLKLVHTEDHSHWITEDLTVSNKDSHSSLLAQDQVANHQVKTEQSALAELDSLIGLADVKRQVHEFVNMAKMQELMRQRHIVSDDKNGQSSLHMVFGGSAGTGKTTVAHIVARALYENGVLKQNKMVVATAKDLVAGFVGQTAPKTHKKCMEALNGILFIDEAYQLASPRHGSSSFNDEAVTQLIADAENYRDQLVVILAGYEVDMHRFFAEGNEGLASRFSNWVTFPDYSPEELCEILRYHLQRMHLHFDQSQTQQLAEYALTKIAEIQVRGSGNGRLVRNYIDELKLCQNSRLAQFDTAQITDEMMLTIQQSDVQAAFQKAYARMQSLRKAYLTNLQQRATTDKNAAQELRQLQSQK